MNRKNSIIISSIVIVLTLLILLLFSQQQSPRTVNKDTVDSVASNVTFKQYNRNGKLASRITAKKITHYVIDDRSHSIAPRMLFYNDDGSVWHVRADYANGYGNSKIELWHHVILHQPASSNHAETTITTNALTVYPERSLAITHQHATLKQPGTVLQGDGVVINTKLGTARILNHSQGSYHPLQQKSHV